MSNADNSKALKILMNNCKKSITDMVFSKDLNAFTEVIPYLEEIENLIHELKTKFSFFNPNQLQLFTESLSLQDSFIIIDTDKKSLILFVSPGIIETLDCNISQFKTYAKYKIESKFSYISVYFSFTNSDKRFITNDHENYIAIEKTINSLFDEVYSTDFSMIPF